MLMELSHNVPLITDSAFCKGLGLCQEIQCARKAKATVNKMIPSPMYKPVGLTGLSVPTVIWFIFLVNPVAATIATWIMIKATKASMTRK